MANLQCIECGKVFDAEGWDPMGGDCSVVRETSSGVVIAPHGEFATMADFLMNNKMEVQ